MGADQARLIAAACINFPRAWRHWSIHRQSAPRSISDGVRTLTARMSWSRTTTASG